MRYAGTVAVTLGFAAGAAHAVDITLNMNGFPNLSNGQVTGTGIVTPIPLPANAATVNLPGLVAGGSYGVDFFHNSGLTGSDFGFTVNGAGTGVDTVSNNGHGFGPYQMVTGFTSGATTLVLDANNVTYNVGGKMTGPYWMPGYLPNAAPAGPVTVRAIAGDASVDHLYNQDLGNEDWMLRFDDAGQAFASSGSSGPAGNPIPHSEYASFSASGVEVRAKTAHYTYQASAPVFAPVGHAYATSNVVSTATSGSFDMDATIGSAGFNLWSMNGYTVVASNIVKSDGTPLQGTVAAGDFIFTPLLRYDGLPGPGDGFYFQAPLGGKEYIAFATIVGLNELGGQPVTVTFTAAIPEPAGLGVLAAGAALALRRRRR